MILNDRKEGANYMASEIEISSRCAMAPDGQADIFEMNVASKSKKRVTKFKGIDVNGRYIDNESRIVFISNRLGYPNVFKKSINSGLRSTLWVRLNPGPTSGDQLPGAGDSSGDGAVPYKTICCSISSSPCGSSAGWRFP